MNSSTTRGTPPDSPVTERRMTMRSLGGILKAAIIAGLMGGAVSAAFHSLLTERVIEKSIALEEAMIVARGQAPVPPVVDRPTQRKGLIVGFLLYGLTWGLLFGVLFHVSRPWQPPEWMGARRGVIAALMTGWSVAVLPFLKYPANPPGVGDPATITHRQGLYFTFIILSTAGTTLALALHRYLGPQARRGLKWGTGWWPVAAMYTVYAGAIYLAMPANYDLVLMPSELLWTFRALSLAGLIVFWVVLAAAFAWLSRDETPPALGRWAIS
jgi:hypothetical protein